MSEIRRIAVAACPKCNEVIWSEHDNPACPRCREPLPESIKASLPKLRPAPPPEPRRQGATPRPSPPAFDDRAAAVTDADSAPASQSHESMSAMRRYKDAYRVARVTVMIGTGIKVFGFLLAILIFASTWLGTAFVGFNRFEAQAGLVAGVISVLVIVTLFYVAGVIVCAQGETLKANLDGAVHSSPFLTDEQRAKVMSL